MGVSKLSKVQEKGQVTSKRTGTRENVGYEA